MSSRPAAFTATEKMFGIVNKRGHFLQAEACVAEEAEVLRDEVLPELLAEQPEEGWRVVELRPVQWHRQRRSTEATA